MEQVVDRRAESGAEPQAPTPENPLDAAFVRFRKAQERHDVRAARQAQRDLRALGISVVALGAGRPPR